MDAFHDRPSIVLAAFARTGLEVDLFEFAFPDIADEQIASLSVKCETPRVAQTQSPNLASVACGLSEWIARGNSVRRDAGFYVYPQHLPEKSARILRPICGVARRAAVACAYVKVAVSWPKRQMSAVMKFVRLIDSQNGLSALWIGDIGIGG